MGIRITGERNRAETGGVKGGKHERRHLVSCSHHTNGNVPLELPGPVLLTVLFSWLKGFQHLPSATR